MSTGPVPQPTPLTRPFWEGTARGELCIQRCLTCRRHYFYPRPVCPNCGSSDVAWVKVSGRATLASYAINYRVAPQFESSEPQIIALVELEEGVRMATNIVGAAADPAALQLGMKLRVAFEPRGDQVLPVFTPEDVRE